MYTSNETEVLSGLINSPLPHLWIEIKLSWLVGKLGNGVVDSQDLS